MTSAIIFWSAASLMLYALCGYPALLWFLTRSAKGPTLPEGEEDHLPSVSIIIAAYNEEAAIATKLDNTLALEYPKDKLEIIVASDGSTDRTNDIVSWYAGRGVKLVSHPQNRGKTVIQDDAVKQSAGEIILFSDATGIYSADAVKQMVRHFADPTVGCVAGNVQDASARPNEITRGTKSYIGYENYLRQKESDLGILAVAPGSIFAVRRSLYRPVPAHLSDDFITPMNVIEQGCRVVFEPAAVSWETIVNTPRQKFRQTERTVTLDLPGLLSKSNLLNPFKHPGPAFALASHKILRWLLPVFLLALYVSSMLLSADWFYLWCHAAQAVFYLCALIGYGCVLAGIRLRLFTAPYYFVLLMAADIKGIANVIMGRRSGRWQTDR